MFLDSNKQIEKEWTVFLVDDDRDDRDLFIDALQESDYHVKVKTFKTGTEILEKLEISSRLPDMIFVDLYMPEMDGEYCLREVRKRKRYKHTPIIIYSNVFDLSRIELLFELGANRYLQKPKTFSALKTALSRIIVSVSKNPTGGQAIINYS